ncbi:MAG: urea ABC transporter permease subunit UrtB [Pseudomonadota bacterium]
MRHFLILLLSLGLFAEAASSPSLEEQIAALNQKSFNAKITAVQNLAITGDNRVVPILEALLNGKLFIRKSDQKIVIAAKQGKVYILYEPLTLAEIEPVKKRKLKKIRINNQVRKAIRAALGGLKLFDPEPEQRLQAAEAVFKSRKVDLLPTLEKALEGETERAVQDKMTMALAATRLSSAAEPETRISAAQTLANYTEPDVRAFLGSLLIEQQDGSFPESDAQVRAAVAESIKKIEKDLAFWAFIGNLFQGISLGSVLLLASIGLAITFGVMGVINMAHGEMVMLGAYTTFIVQDIFRTLMPEAFDYSLLVAVPAAFLVAGLFGILIERGIIRFLYTRPLETLLATWGISLILQQLVRSIFGPTNQEVGNPSWMSGAIELSGGVLLTYNRIWIIVFSLVVFVCLLVILRKSRFGLQMRAVTQNRRMASSMGIRTGTIDAFTFGLGSAIAGIAGVALSQIDNVSPNLGQSYIIDAFMVVVFGGVGNLWGTLVGAMSLGITNKFLEPYAGAVLAKILILVAIILFIQKRPRGLFALKGRAVET